jgi:putative aldouronate transport system substrate-binding protein
MPGYNRRRPAGKNTGIFEKRFSKKHTTGSNRENLFLGGLYMKRFLFLTGIAFVFMGVLAGCNQSQTTSGGEVKLTAIAITHQLTKDLNDMQWLKELQNKAGVSVTWQQISADWGEKKSALFASGDIPDFLINATTDSDYSVYNGLFADLSPLIESTGPNIKKMFSEKPEIKALSTQMDGKIYGLPLYRRFGAIVVSPMFINKTWLDRVGKKVPTNWDELKDVLLAFRDQDANGNGDKNDEIGMDFNPMDWLFTPKYLMGSLGLPISNYGETGYFVEDGKIKNYYVDDRFKTLMLFLRDLYAEGLINKECVTQDYSQFQSLARNDGKYAKVGFTFGWTAGDRFGPQLEGEYITIPPLKYKANSTNTVYYAYDSHAQNYMPNRFSMSARSTKKEAVLRFIDMWFDPIISMQVEWGGMNDYDKGIKDNGDGTYSVLPPADPEMNAGIWKWTIGFGENAPYYIADYLKVTPDADQSEPETSRMPYRDQLKLYDPKTSIYPDTFMKYSTEDTQTLAMNQANISNICNRWAVWLTGDGNIEAEWDAYVKSIYDAGLNKNLEIRQKAFDAYVKTL